MRLFFVSNLTEFLFNSNHANEIPTVQSVVIETLYLESAKP